MKKVTLKEVNNQDVIIVDTPFITRVCDAMHSLETALFAVENYAPESAGSFKTNVCDFIKEMHDAFLEGC